MIKQDKTKLNVIKTENAQHPNWPQNYKTYWLQAEKGPLPSLLMDYKSKSKCKRRVKQGLLMSETKKTSL